MVGENLLTPKLHYHYARTLKCHWLWTSCYDDVWQWAVWDLTETRRDHFLAWINNECQQNVVDLMHIFITVIKQDRLRCHLDGLLWPWLLTSKIYSGHQQQLVATPCKFHEHFSSRSWDIVVTSSVRMNEKTKERTNAAAEATENIILFPTLLGSQRITTT